MKILFILLTIVSVSFAQKAKQAAAKPKAYARPYGMAGCGLGSIVMGKHGSQVSAGTTNGTAGNQTFAITAGTSNCVDDNAAEVAHKMDNYIQINKVQLAGDVAKGNGETIIALSDVIGCQSSRNLAMALRSNYKSIFGSDFTTNNLTDSIITVIQNDSALAGECSLNNI